MKSLRLVLALGFLSALFAGVAGAADEKKPEDESCSQSSCSKGDKSAKKDEKKPEDKSCSESSCCKGDKSAKKEEKKP